MMSRRKIVIENSLRRCLLLVLTAVLVPAVAAACGPGPSATPAHTPTPAPTALPVVVPQHGWQLPADQYVLIEHQTNTNGSCAKGDCEPRQLAIDFPTYTFNSTTGTLESWNPVEVNDALKVVCGGGGSLSGLAGTGESTGLEEVYDLPAEVCSLRIVQVDRDGTVYLAHGGVMLMLAPGKAWTKTTEELQKQGGGTVKLTTYEWIRNRGILDKAKILFPTPGP